MTEHDLNPPQLGHIVQQFRKGQNLTLEQLAERSGISRAMLSQIERGGANPTIGLVWKLTRALGVSLSDLVPLLGDQPKDHVELLTAAGTPEIRNTEGSCRMRILSPPRLVGKAEWYQVYLDPDGTLSSEAHASGAWEHLTPLDGELSVHSGQNELRIQTAGTARYPADVAHSIHNPTNKVVQALLVTLYP